MSVHNDTLQGLNEALEYVKGRLELKETIIDIPDDEIKFYSTYEKLTDDNKLKVMEYVDALLG